MPQTVPLGRAHYVQYLRTTPEAPRREPARTHEVKGKRRHGEGAAYRLFGSHAFVLGRWTGQAMTEQERTEYEYQSQDGERMDPWGRLIRPEEIDTVAGQVFKQKVDKGWQPEPWHWRFYYERVQRVFGNIGVLNVVAYNDVHFTPRRFVQMLWDRLKMRLFPVQEVEPVAMLSEWRNREAESDDEGLCL